MIVLVEDSFITRYVSAAAFRRYEVGRGPSLRASNTHRTRAAMKVGLSGSEVFLAIVLHHYQDSLKCKYRLADAVWTPRNELRNEATVPRAG